ncbi:MAG: TonB-dependent receptor [Acidobacteriaceae bacterium]
MLFCVRITAAISLASFLAPVAALAQNIIAPPVLPAAQTGAVQYILQGRVLSADDAPVAHAEIWIGQQQVATDATGKFQVTLPRGTYELRAHTAQSTYHSLVVEVDQDETIDIHMPADASIVVRGGVTADIELPDPSTVGYDAKDLIAANPGRPGVPFSVPGFPVETASGGIKAPQYFAPGVAGDHGVPIAQYFDIAGFLFQNNLTANAHGNGYSDPNVLIPTTVSAITVDDAAFNALYGDHAVNLAVTYYLGDRFRPFLVATKDGHDVDLQGAWSPKNPRIREWAAFEASIGNGFLARPEEREQYKLNWYRTWTPGKHELTAFFLGYYGFSRVPGLIPLYTPVTDDTLDPRQMDLTHTTLSILTDRWHPSQSQQLQLSGYLRTYSLDLKSNFGLGLIRQSEFRTVAGANATYDWRFAPHYTLLAGLDFRRDAPRGLDLAKVNANGVFQLVTSNDLTITDTAPFLALNGIVNRNLQVYAGVRRDQIDFKNVDYLTPSNSFDHWPGLTSPKLSVTLGRPDAEFLPSVAFSFAKAFHANDPRIGTGTAEPSLTTTSRAYQLVATKLLDGTEFRVLLEHITNSEEFANIDPDTGLQQALGPSLNRFFTVGAKRRSDWGFWQASYSHANATDLQLHQPVPEAPRLIVDALGELDHLPWGIQGQAEFDYVGEKPLGDGFNAVPVREIRLNFQKVFSDGHWIAALSGLLANGATGQTLETFALPDEPAPIERIVGVPLRSYGSASLVYQF